MHRYACVCAFLHGQRQPGKQRSNYRIQFAVRQEKTDIICYRKLWLNSYYPSLNASSVFLMQITPAINTQTSTKPNTYKKKNDQRRRPNRYRSIESNSKLNRSINQSIICVQIDTIAYLFRIASMKVSLSNLIRGCRSRIRKVVYIYPK